MVGDAAAGAATGPPPADAVAAAAAAPDVVRADAPVAAGPPQTQYVDVVSQMQAEVHRLSELALATVGELQVRPGVASSWLVDAWTHAHGVACTPRATTMHGGAQTDSTCSLGLSANIG